MSKNHKNSSIYTVIKRIFDIIITLLAFVLTSPIFLFALVLILTDSEAKGGGIIFRQHRVGKDSRIFNIYKFRTMRADAPDEIPTGELDDADKYITRSGKLLRKTSIDELPQLLNVLKGDMSLVGPRPLVRTETDVHKLRVKNGIYDVLPGVTGWAQVNGRDFVTPEQKVKYDLEYINNMSFWFDVKILFLTFYQVFTGYGIVDGECDCDKEKETDN